MKKVFAFAVTVVVFLMQALCAGPSSYSPKTEKPSLYAANGMPDTNLSAAYAYPVPYKPSQHGGGITFTNLSSSADIEIYTLSGELVRKLQETDGDGQLIWDPVANENGEPLASDVFFYLIKNSQQKKTGKLLIVR